MAWRNRQTLKNYFKKGSLPTEEHFFDLIDSMLNIIDEGFHKTAEDGLKIRPIGNSESLISFFKDIELKSPIWSIKNDKKNDNLFFTNSTMKDILTLTLDSKVGINKEPEHELDVDGVISITGRIGNYKKRESKVALADGQWHCIIENLNGCCAYEIMAGVGKKKSGKYALLHAYALNTFNSKSKIVYHQAYYNSRCNKIKLRWIGQQDNYNLEIKTACNYEGDIQIKYYITELWFDPFMDECHRENEE